MKNVVTVARSALAGMPLSEGDKQLLAEVGLLDDPESHLRPLAIPRVLDAGVQIATEGEVAPVVVLATGSVRMLDDGPGRFVNASLPQLARALEVYEKHRAEAGSAMDPPSRKAARALRDALKAVDAACVADPEAYWSVIVEQVRDGLL